MSASWTNFIHLENQPMGDDERQFCKNWLDQRDNSMGLVTITLGSAFHVTGLIVDRFFVERHEMLEFFTFVHLVAIACAVIYFLVKRRSSSVLHPLVLISQLVTLFSYAYTLSWILRVQPELSLSHVKAWTAYVVLGVFITIFSPFRSFISLIYSFVLTTLSWMAWSQIPDANQMVGISAFAFIAAQIFQRASVMGSLEESRREFANRSKIAEAQKEAYNQQLIVARNIQDSFAAPQEFSNPGIQIRFFQKRSEAVGGDWMALRSDNNGKVTILVADAAGKGVQAALVTHAVQALWADALSEKDFNPGKWLAKVNNTLCRMGQGESHSATVGIISISGKQVEYWCAGHTPAIVVPNSDNKTIYPLPARGPMLGLTLVHEFTSHQREVTDEQFHILLGSDGVFERGSTVSPRSIREIFNAAKQDADFLSNLHFHHDDDRTLVLINVEPSKMTSTSVQ